jgi:hypothetical protein
MTTGYLLWGIDMIKNILKKIKLLILDFQMFRSAKNDIFKLTEEIDPNCKNDMATRYMIIIQALKKQTHKSIERFEDYDGDDENGKPINRVYYPCGSCGRTISQSHTYCPECGQRL